jgi:hypothetical protein
MPPSVQRSDARHYRWNTVTEVKEDHALDWAVQHASAQPTAGRRH